MIYTGSEAGDALQGSATSDFASGYGGNDTLSGGDGSDDLDGGAGRDALSGESGDDTLHGDAGDDTLTGGDGNDLIVDLQNFNGSADLILGGAGDDTLDGGGGLDQIDGGAGNDEIIGGARGVPNIHPILSGGDGNDMFGTDYASVVNGGAGRDVIFLRDLDSNTALDITLGDSTPFAAGGLITDVEEYGQVFGGYSDDIIRVGALVETSREFNYFYGGGPPGLFGGSGNDTLVGGVGGNTLIGDGGDDLLQGGDGADTLDGSGGSDRLEGGAGFDTATFGFPESMTVDLAAGLATSDSGVDQLVSIENVIGSLFNDTLLGDAGDNVFAPNGGWDRIDGRGGFDILDLRSGENPYDLTVRLSVTTRQDFDDGGVQLSGIEGIIGSLNNDSLFGTGGADLLDGSDGNDYLEGGTGKDTLRGGGGADTLIGGAGKDSIDGGGGDDTVEFKNWSEARGDVIDGGSGSDTLRIDRASHGKADLRSLSFSGFEQLSAVGIDVALSAAQFRKFDLLFADKITITDPGTILVKFENHQSAVSHAPIGRVDLANGDNAFDMRALTLNFDGGGIGEVHGGKAEDVIFGSIYRDRLYGGEGRDKLYGGQSDDALDGGTGADVLKGNAGDDTLNGGKGADVMKGGDGDDLYYVDSAQDRIEDTGGHDTVRVSDDYRLGSGLEDLILADAANVHGNGRNNMITGSAGKDTIYGEGGNDTIVGGAGSDTIYGGTGVNDIDGGSGNDVIYSNRGNVVGGKGYDVLYWVGDYLIADKTVEEIRVTGSNRYVSGGSLDNLLIGAEKQANHLFGGGGDDTVVGGAKADEIGGNSGDDLLTGGKGADTFYFDEFSTTVVDEITDYDSAEGDVLNFTALEDAAIQAGVTSISYLGTGAFTGHAGEARIDLHSRYGLFMFDLNGDRVSDLTIKLDGVTASTTIAYLL